MSFLIFEYSLDEFYKFSRFCSEPSFFFFLTLGVCAKKHLLIFCLPATGLRCPPPLLFLGAKKKSKCLNPTIWHNLFSFFKYQSIFGLPVAQIIYVESLQFVERNRLIFRDGGTCCPACAKFLLEETITMHFC